MRNFEQFKITLASARVAQRKIIGKSLFLIFRVTLFEFHRAHRRQRVVDIIERVKENVYLMIPVSAALFTDLDLLSEGDRFFIYVLDRALAYEVDQILEVEPDETESLDVSEDGDLVTLVTCTPYGVNSHRLLVRGHRVEYTESDVAEAKKNAVGSIYTNYTLWLTVSATFTVVFVVSMILFIKKRKPVEDGTDRKKTDRSGGQRQ